MSDSYVARVQGTPSLTEGEMNHLNIDENGNLLCNVAQGSFAVSTGAQYNLVPPTLTSGQTGPLQCDVNGKMLISGSINATSAATYNSTPPTFTSGTSNPLQADVNGNLKVNLTNNGLGSLSAPVRTDPTGTTPQPISGSVSVSNFPPTQPVSAVSLPLPSGAATAAKQPALGTAGTPSSDVLTVQGAASMTALQVAGTLAVSNFPATQPVSGTVSINAIPAGTNTIGSVKLTDGTSVATIASLASAKALDVAIVDGTGTQITSFGGGTQYADGVTQSTPTGTVALGKNPSNLLHALALDGAGNLNVNVAAGGASGGTSSSYGSAFPTTGTAIGASDGTNMQGLLVESSTNKNLRVGIYSGANEATVTAGNALKVDGSAVTQPVSGTFWQPTQPVSAASLPLPAGAATSAKQPALGTAGTAASDVITVQGIASMTALKVDGSAVTQPVSLASVPTHAVTQSGTWTVQPGNTANTTPWLMQDVPATSGGLSTYTGQIGATVTQIKGSAGQIYAYDFFNENASTTAYVQVFYKPAASVTLGTTTPDNVLVIPGGAGKNVAIPQGFGSGTGLSFAVTTTRTGATGLASACDVTFYYV